MFESFKSYNSMVTLLQPRIYVSASSKKYQSRRRIEGKIITTKGKCKLIHVMII